MGGWGEGALTAAPTHPHPLYLCARQPGWLCGRCCGRRRRVPSGHRGKAPQTKQTDVPKAGPALPALPGLAPPAPAGLSFPRCKMRIPKASSFLPFPARIIPGSLQGDCILFPPQNHCAEGRARAKAGSFWIASIPLHNPGVLPPKMSPVPFWASVQTTTRQVLSSPPLLGRGVFLETPPPPRNLRLWLRLGLSKYSLG